MADVKLITKLKEDLNRAISEKDVSGAIRAFADKSLMFLLAPPLQFKTGIDAPGAKALEEWFSTFENKIELAYLDFEITINGDVAFTHCIEHLKGKRTDGSYTDMWYRETLGLQKIEGHWKITHQHQSVPFYMDGSEKAATDLKP